MAKLKSSSVKSWVVGIVIALLAIGLLTAGLTLLRSPVQEISAGTYAVGTINERGVAEEDEGSLYTKDFINADGLQIKLDEDAEVTYKVYFYGEEKEFISATEELSADLTDSDIPEGAEYAKIVITPTEDEDGKIGFFEKGGYVDMLTVTTYNK